jgi:hypothetical protein
MARYNFLHATKFLALLFSTDINDYSLCGDMQLDTKIPAVCVVCQRVFFAA